MAVLITACAVYVLLRRRQRQTADAASDDAHLPEAVDGNAPKYPDYPVELMGQTAAEMAAHPHDRWPRYEMG